MKKWRTLVVLLVAACSGSDGEHPAADGSIADGTLAMIDGMAEVDGGPADEGTVTLHYIDMAGKPAAGLELALADPEGRLTGTATTDVSGSATVTVTAGGSVSWLVLEGLRTVFGLELGADLTIPDLPEVISFGSAGSVNIKFDAGFPGANWFVVENGCEANRVSFAGFPSFAYLRYHAGCRTPDGKLDIIVRAEDQQSHSIAYAMLRPSVPATSSTPIEVMVGPWQTDLTDLKVTVSDLPSIKGGFGATLFLRKSGPGRLYGSWATDGYHQGGSMEGSFVLHARVLPGFYDEALVDVLSYEDYTISPRLVGAAAIVDEIASVQLTRAKLPPTLRQLTLKDDVVSWEPTRDAPGALALSGWSLRGKMWRFVAPLLPGARRLPTLPPTMIEAWRSTGMETTSSGSLSIVEYPNTSDYAGALGELQPYGLTSLPLPAAGSFLGRSTRYSTVYLP